MKRKLYLGLLLCLTFPGMQAFSQTTIGPAPANLRIDGKLTEFSDSLTDYDKSTHLYYAFAHDAGNLYVFVKANNRQDQSKIMAGGISIAVNADGRKKAGATITFPVIDRQAMMAEMRSRRQSSGSTERPDMNEMRQHMLSQLKEIKVAGLQGIDMESISIYNQYGIKVGINYNAQNALEYELAVPFKYLGIDPNKTDEIAVNVKVNGLQMPEGGFGNRGGDSGGMRGGYGNSDGGGMSGGGMRGGEGSYGGRSGRPDFSAMMNPADFWIKAKLVN